MASQVYGNGTSTSTNGANVRVDALIEKGIRTAKRDIIFEQLCDSRTLPMQHGKTLKVHKTLYILDDANVNDQGLDSTGVKQAPNANGNLYGSSRSVVDVTNGLPLLSEGAGRVNRVGVTRITKEGTLTRMGAFLEYTDEVDKFSDAKMESQYYEKMGELAAELYDDYLQKELLGACGIEVYGGVATSLLTVSGIDDTTVAGNETALEYETILNVEDSLEANYAKMNTSIIDGSRNVGTVPVNASYFAYCGRETVRTLNGLQDDFSQKAFVPARMYAAAGNLAKNEVGAVHSTRFIQAQRMMRYDGCGAVVGANPLGGFKSTTLTGAQATARGQSGAGTYYDGLPIIYVTKGAFATVGLQGNKKINFLSKKPGQATYEDPHGLQGIYSFNFFAGSITLEPEKMARIVHATKF
jgi:N4-gp56 family major capsid protein